jgi:NitT/TauT family transport system substrate-binding protein
MKSKWRAWGLGIAGAMIGVSALATSVQAQTELKLRLEWTPILIHSWYFLAEERGWYKEEGLKVEIESGRGSVNTTQVVASGSHDIGQASHSAMSVGRAKEGLKVKAIAALIRKNEMGILVPQGSGWKGPKDLVDNKVKIVTSPGGFDIPFLEPWFRLGGTNYKDATFVSVDTTIKGATYVNKGGDAVSTSPAFFRAIFAAQGRPSDIFWMADLGVDVPGTGIIASEKAIAEKPEAIRGFLRATTRAMDHILGKKNYEDAFNAVLKLRPESKPNKDVMMAQFKDHEFLWVTDETKGKPWGFMGVKDWERAIKIMADINVIPAGMNPTEFYTNDLLPKVTN